MNDGMDDDCASMSESWNHGTDRGVWPFWSWLDLTVWALELPQVLVFHSSSRQI